MVCRLDPESCMCGICDGGQRAPEGYFGGSYCPCQCHSLKGDERKAFIEERDRALDAAIDSALARRLQSPPDAEGGK